MDGWHGSVMGLHEGAESAVEGFADLVGGESPTEEPFGFVGVHVDAAAAHGDAEIFVPVCAVEGVSLRCEEKRPGHAGKFVIIKICEEVAVAHVFGGHFVQDAEVAGRRFGRDAIRVTRTVGDAGSDECFQDRFVMFVGSEGLGGQVHLDAFVLHLHLRADGRSFHREWRQNRMDETSSPCKQVESQQVV